MADVKWIKITTDIFDDEKILLIEALPDADSIIVIWFKLLCLAGKMNNSGVFLINDKIAYTDKMLAAVFRRKESTVKLALETFEQFGMIEVVNDVITIPNWDKHQTLDAYEKKKERDRLYQAERRNKQRLIADKSSDNTSDVVVSDKEEYIDIKESISKDIPKKSDEWNYSKHTNKENAYHIVTNNIFTDSEYLKQNQELWETVTEWLDYKDQKKPKADNHYDTEKGLCKLLKLFVDHAKEYGIETVKQVVEFTMANDYQGVVWDRCKKKADPKPAYDANKGLIKGHYDFAALELETKNRHLTTETKPIIEPEKKQLSKLQKHILSLPINKDFHFEHEGKEFWGTRYENSVSVLLKSGDNEQFLIDKLEEHLDELPDYKR